METLDTFKQVSDLKVNVQKTEVLNLDNYCTELCPQLRFKNWVKTHCKVLGIDISRDISKMLKDNKGKILERIKTLINTWGKCKLSLMGKISIVKTLLIPQLLYLFNNLPTPNNKCMPEIEQTIYKFIWITNQNV